MQLQGHKKWITAVAWEPAHLLSPSRRFASASKDGDIRIWDTTLRKTVMCLTGHTLAVTCVKWSGEGFIYSRYGSCGDQPRSHRGLSFHTLKLLLYSELKVKYVNGFYAVLKIAL